MTTRRDHLHLALLCFGLLGALGLAIELGLLSTADAQVSSDARSWAIERPWLEGPLLAVEWVFEARTVMWMGVVLAGVLLVRRHARAAVLVAAVSVATRELTQHAKALFGRDRPLWQDTDHLLGSGSYPSGHAAGIVALAGLLVVLTFAHTRRTETRRLVSVAAGAVVLLVFADRLMLGRHYVTDLLGGALLSTGLILVGLAIVGPLRPVEMQQRRRPVSSGAPVAVGVLVSRSA
ncbi:phosphatase PAP2 family protein [Nocardioides humilatus]|uniref:phosphatase PAP2 family protein n=1 Tax=Nocardioides humilatus TaxID=2607660 RepID=UPI00165F4B78|nr:phosphatase PAP2 family protein [Nocardioides humilatus]